MKISNEHDELVHKMVSFYCRSISSDLKKSELDLGLCIAIIANTASNLMANSLETISIHTKGNRDSHQKALIDFLSMIVHGIRSKGFDFDINDEVIQAIDTATPRQATGKN